MKIHKKYYIISQETKQKNNKEQGCAGLLNPLGGAVFSVVGGLPRCQADLVCAKLRVVFQSDVLYANVPHSN